MNMSKRTIGANILENLTTGMYQDSKVIFREYIQNSCDQIDKAIKSGLLSAEDAQIEIWLNTRSRIVSIEDNATGIPVADFRRILGNIADSDKQIGEDKGFRGIGRLCGLAYCEKLIFTSSAYGETIESVAEYDAQLMRRLIADNVRGNKKSVDDVLDATENYYQSKKAVSSDSHYFKVELIGINDENTDLLDKKRINEYLSFIAPVPYQNTFYYRNKIYGYANNLNVKIDEYDIRLEGEPIFKKYATILKDSNNTKCDDIFDIDFKDFYDENGELIAWLWYGISKFNRTIPACNQMRSLRLRKENIQIGGEDTLQKMFKEDRGHHYFIGEVFALSKDLIPNSQRDYFNENPMRVEFEKQVRNFFRDHFHTTYYDGSKINSAYKKIESFDKKVAEFKERESQGTFVNEEERQNEYKAIEIAQKEADKAKQDLVKKRENANPIIQKVLEKREEEYKKTATAPKLPAPPEKKMTKYRTDTLSAYNRKERKLISEIFGIIRRATDSVMADEIISRIEDELQ